MSIDRRALVSRHNVVLTAADARLPVTVGNGDFAFTADITGMQTFRDFHDPSVAAAARPGESPAPTTNTCTQSSWGWHEMPNPENYRLADAMTAYETERGQVEYPDKFDMMAAFGGMVDADKAAGTWLHLNPQRLDLGRIGLVFLPFPGGDTETDPAVLSDIRQVLSLWTGVLTSEFTYAGERVSVTTACHPDRAEVAFRITSSLFAARRLDIQFDFPYASTNFFQTSDFNAPDAHQTDVEVQGTKAEITRTLDAMTYGVGANWTEGVLWQPANPHQQRIRSDADTLELVVRFTDGPPETPRASVDEIISAATQGWESFWRSGAALELHASADPRANELERRIVLSQYLTKVNCSGVNPPQETGLVCNSWQGKFHLEMHWWHSAHFVAWGRAELLIRSLDWYDSILPKARETAAQQGYQGARWPKHVGPDGRESPSEIGSLLLWQQPHPLYLAELIYRNQPDEAVVARFRDVVHESALFMASILEERDGVFQLLSPIVPAQEFYDPRTTENPTYELAYWWWGLEIAQRWRERQGLHRDHAWTDIQDRLAQPHQQDGKYTAIATEPYLMRNDHPSLLMALGFLPATPLIDTKIMQATLADVLTNWEWPTAWGWDFPTIAMTATRLGDPEGAVNALMMDAGKNTYLANGHNPQIGNMIPLYLPGNGSLLAAVSLMVAGWDGSDRLTPGFPDDGTWTVTHEGFSPWP